MVQINYTGSLIAPRGSLTCSANCEFQNILLRPNTNTDRNKHTLSLHSAGILPSSPGHVNCQLLVCHPPQVSNGAYVSLPFHLAAPPTSTKCTRNSAIYTLSAAARSYRPRPEICRYRPQRVCRASPATSRVEMQAQIASEEVVKGQGKCLHK